MRSWIFAAIIGLTTCNQAWAWDDEDDFFDRKRRIRNESYSPTGDPELDGMIRQMERDQAIRRQKEMLENQRELLKMEKQNHEELLRLEKRRLELQEREQQRRVIENIGRD